MNLRMDNDKAGKIELLKGDFARRLALALVPTIKAGFPSPADDYLHDSLDFNRDLIKNPEATFYGRVSGDSMIEAGICDSDIAVIDRSLQPVDGDVIVAFVNGEFTIKYLDLKHKEEATSSCDPPTLTICLYASTPTTTSVCGASWCGL